MSASQSIRAALQEQRAYFRTHQTKSLEFRDEKLRGLADAIRENEAAILEAVRGDLGRSAEEAFLGEIALLYEEIRYTRKNLRKWAEPSRVFTPISAAVGRSEIRPEPLGVVLILGPWNYPFQLVVAPLIGAVAAGNCAVLKPSEHAPQVSGILARVIGGAFAPRHVQVKEGGVEVSEALLAEKWDHIFFTGGTEIGKVVMAAAARHLTPVTLELGGKSPCIVDRGTDLTVTARRIAWGKFFNAGQTCVAPDYVLVPPESKRALVLALAIAVREFFGEHPEESPDYARIINVRHFERLSGLLGQGRTEFGGAARARDRYIAPTALTEVSLQSRLMTEEIFGPLLPILEYDSLDTAIDFVNERPKPLALYFFSRTKENQDRVLKEVAFGGGCVNDTLVHLSNPRLPFGGVGDSGMGAYHGKFSFDTFSHRKSVMKKSFFPDFLLRYPPYEGKLPFFRRFLR